MKQKLFCLVAAVVCLLLAAGGVRAQEKDAPKVEVGVQFSTLEHNPPDFFGTDTLPGFGGRVTYNLNDHVALEAEGNFFPQRGFFGRVTQGQFGVKAGKRYNKFGIFAKARPGLVSFGNVSTAVGLREIDDGTGGTITIPEFRSERKTYFSMDVGGVLEFYPSRKIVVRADAGDTIIRYGERNECCVFGPDGVTGFIPRPASWSHNFQLTTGIGFRFMNPEGAGDDAAGASSTDEGTPRFEAGIQYTSLTLNPPRTRFALPVVSDFDPPAFTLPAVGGRLTYNFTDHIAADAAVDFFTKQTFAASTYGGHGIQGQFGVKVGKRYDKFGIFAKARPGFITFSRVEQLVGTQTFTFNNQQFVAGVFEDRRKTYFSMDVGGVFEFYPSRRIVTRFDVGDTIIRYKDRVTRGFLLDVPFLAQPDETKHNFQFTAGIGLRF